MSKMPNAFILDFISENGIPFRAVYGIRNGVSGKPITEYGKVVAFYDRRYPQTEYGQFVSDYDPRTLLARDSSSGLNLSGGVPDWTIDRANMVTVLDWLEMLIENLG